MDPTVLYQLSYGVYALGIMDGTRPTGCIVNTVFQITSENPTIALSLNKNNYTTGLVEQHKRFTVSILTETVAGKVIGNLGFLSGRDQDKFANIPYALMGGLPIVKEGASGYLLCEVTSVTENGTHHIIVAKVLDTQMGVEGVPMTYKYYHDVKKGSAPQNAPTYRGVEVSKTSKKPTVPRYVCTVCGYVHEGELPPDFECPICGMPASVFKLQTDV